MTNSYHPFFNRKYLTGLIWFCLLAILVLTSMGPDEPEPGDVHIDPDTGIYWQEQPDQPLLLSLILPTQPALHPRHQLLQQLMQTVLQQRLKAFADPGYSYQVERNQDSLIITLSWLEHQPQPPVTDILENLREPIDPIRWLPALEKLKAAAYLDNQATDQQLLNRFLGQLDPAGSDPVIEQLASAYAALFQHLQLSLTGSEAEQVLQSLPVTADQAHAQQPAASLTLAAERITDEPVDDRFHLLLGSTTAGRNSTQFIQQRLVTRVLEDLLAGYRQQAPELAYRLLFSTLQQQGYRILLLHSSRHPAQVLQALQQSVSEKQVAQSRDQLLSQWREQLSDPAIQRQWINLMARYQLPENTLIDYPEQLLELDPEDTVAAVQLALQSQHQFSILLPPN